MEPPKNCVTETSASSREGNSSHHETQQENKSTASLTLSTESLEPKRGDHLMEPRIPEESAAVVTPHESFPSTSTEDNNTSQSYPPPPKRQRTVTVREFLNQRAQQLIDEVNDKRKADTLLLTDFKKAMEMQVATSYGILEQSMYQMYERNGKIMQAKLQELFATLDRIATLEAELQKFKEALGALYSDIQYPS